MRYCQFNEEEILDEILKKVGTTNKFAVKFGEEKGYTLVEENLANLFFVRNDVWGK